MGPVLFRPAPFCEGRGRGGSFIPGRSCSKLNHMSDSERAVRDAFALQVEWCERLGSPFTARLCEAVGPNIDRSSATGRRLLDWQGDPVVDAVALRLTGGLHALVRRGRLPRLAAFYPPNPLPDAGRLWAGVADAIQDADAELAAWLDSPPQTNEVARSGVLIGGLLTIAAETKFPIALYEIGASAGLNLLLDHYAYRLGELDIGPADAPLKLSPDWVGPPPPAAKLQIVSRRGVDQAPLDVTSTADRDRLLAYVWPDQDQRLARIKSALDFAAANPPPIDRGDAADWIEERIAIEPQPGVVRTVMHSIAFQYFPAAGQRRILDRLAEAGRRATPEAPLAHLRFEVDPTEGSSPSLRLTLWPEGHDQKLAFADPHGRRVRWLG